MLNLMNALIDEDVSVDLLLNHTDIPELPDVREEIDIVRLGKVDGLFRIPPLAHYLRRRQPTVLLVNRETGIRLGSLAVRFGGARTRLAVRGATTLSVALKQRHPLKRWLRRTALAHCYRRADHIIANSKGVARDISDIAGIPLQQIHVVNNPTVSPHMFAQSDDPINHPWFTQGSIPVVIGVGRLAKQKDFSTLMEAFAKLRRRRPCRLVILGEGKERGRLIRLADTLGIQQDVDLPGHVSNPFSYMKRADQFVLSSAWEGSPNVLIQALALGVPVVSTDCPSGPREILANGLYGPLVPVGDVEGLCRAMADTLGNPPDQHLLRKASEPFQVDKCTRAYMEAMGIAGT